MYPKEGKKQRKNDPRYPPSLAQAKTLEGRGVLQHFTNFLIIHFLQSQMQFSKQYCNFGGSFLFMYQKIFCIMILSETSYFVGFRAKTSWSALSSEGG